MSIASRPNLAGQPVSTCVTWSKAHGKPGSPKDLSDADVAIAQAGSDKSQALGRLPWLALLLARALRLRDFFAIACSLRVDVHLTTPPLVAHHPDDHELGKTRRHEHITGAD